MEIIKETLRYEVAAHLNAEQIPVKDLTEAVELANKSEKGVIFIAGDLSLKELEGRLYVFGKRRGIAVFREDYNTPLTEEIVYNDYKKQIEPYINPE